MEKKVKELLSKKPFVRITPLGYQQGAIGLDPTENTNDNPQWQVITQADFLREYHPQGHRINDPIYYPDRVKTNPETGERYTEYVTRCSFPFQSIIATKQIIHLCGNDIRFELTSARETDEEKAISFEMKQGWHFKHSEYAFYSAVKSAKITGDAAYVGYLSENKYMWKVFSYLTGDKLYPHYDKHGKLAMFAREYKAYDEEGRENTSFVDVWDKKFHYEYKRQTNGVKGIKSAVLDYFGMEGYDLIQKTDHGFGRIPVTYFRAADGACWGHSQDSIEKYEMSVSYLAQNNKAFAFPILFLKGDSQIIGGEDIYAPTKAITGAETADAQYITNPDGSKSFELELKILLNNIFMGSFTVLPPELKSGDLPGVAVKLLYSPAIEKAMADAAEWDMFIADMVEIFKIGYGIELGKLTPMQNLKLNTWIEPYVHQNIAEIIQNLQTAVFGGFLSKETASELTPYGKNDEFFRLVKQDKSEEATMQENLPLNG